MRLQRTGPAVLSVLLLTILAPQAASAADAGRFLDNVEGAHPFLDIRWEQAVLPELDADGSTQPIDLPFAFRMEGKAYSRVIVSKDGWIGLLRARPQMDGADLDAKARILLPDSSEPPAAYIDVLRDDWMLADGSRIQMQSEDRRFTVRWVKMASPDGRARATFEAILHEEGAVTYQFLEVRDAYGVTADATVGTRPESGDGVDLRAEGYQPRGGLRVTTVPRPPAGGGGPIPFIAGDCADFDGDTQPDNTAPSWCDVNLDTRCSLAAGTTECGDPCTDCAETDATVWRFYEAPPPVNGFCVGCVYTFYVLVECGTEMHLPFDDMEGARVRISDAITGEYLGVRAENECYKDSIDPNPPVPINQWYCDGCAQGLGIRPAEDLGGAGACAGLGVPALACQIFEVDTTPAEPEICWGALNNCITPWPAPPCVESGGCPGGTGTNPAHESMVTDVVLTEDAGLCGVFRVELVSGAARWDLFANCSGNTEEQFRIFRNCGDALSAWNPLPEYVLESVAQGGQCPVDAADPNRPTVEVELRNVGCCDETGDADSTACPNPVGPIPATVRYEDPDAPGTIVCPGPNPDQSWDLPDFDPAQVKQQSGGTQVVSLDYPCDFSTLPATAIVELDPDDSVVECSEAPGASSCGSIDIPQLTIDVCSCDFFLAPDLVGPTEVCVNVGDPADPSDDTATLTLDGAASVSNPACPNPEYRFFELDPATLDRIGGPINADLTNPTLVDHTFSCRDSEPYAFELEFSCADETLDPIGCPKSVILEGNCFDPDPLVIESIPNLDGDPEREAICVDQDFTLRATVGGSLPLNPLQWTVDLPGGMDTCDCMPGQDCDPVMDCAGLDEQVACGETLTFTASGEELSGCPIEESFEVTVTTDVLRFVRCSLMVGKVNQATDLEFGFNSAGFICPADPAQDILGYTCTGEGYSTCPNGNPPGTGPRNLSNMAADGTVVVSGNNLPLVQAGGALPSGNRLTYFQARSIATCIGPGPLGLPAGQNPGQFGCP